MSASQKRPLIDRLRRIVHRSRFVGDDVLRWSLVWRRRTSDRVRLHGVDIVLDPRLGPGVRRDLLRGRYERGEAFALRARLESTDRVVELGTGLGLLAILAARRVGSEKVVTYEADPALLPLIRENFRRNRVEPSLEHAAVGVGRGTSVLHVGADHQGSSTRGHSGPGGERLTVPRLDAGEEVDRLQPTFLIIDIEGAERDIVPRIDWTPVEKLLIELHPQRFEAGDEELILRQLGDAGFRLDTVVSSRRKKLFLR